MKFQLTKTEEKQRKILVYSGLCLPLIVAAGMISSSADFSKNYILQPVLLFVLLILIIIFCSIYTFNAFTTKNIVRNWASPRIFSFIFNLFSNKHTDEKAEKITIILFGCFTLIIGIACMILCIYFFCTGFPQ